MEDLEQNKEPADKYRRALHAAWIEWQLFGHRGGRLVLLGRMFEEFLGDNQDRALGNGGPSERAEGAHLLDIHHRPGVSGNDDLVVFDHRGAEDVSLAEVTGHVC